MNDKLIIEKVKQLKETAINNQSNWQFPNEHYIEATGMIIALNEVLSVLESSEPGKLKDKVTADIGKSIYYIFQNEERIHGKSKAIDWLKLASYKTATWLKQFKSKEVTDEGLRVTDEEIENWAANFCNKYDSSEYGYGDMIIEGAKAMRDGKIK
jgi:hypothetical protein